MLEAGRGGRSDEVSLFPPTVAALTPIFAEHVGVLGDTPAAQNLAAAVPLSQEGNTTVRYRAVDSSGNFSRGATTNTTLNQPSAAGATAIRLTSTTGRRSTPLTC